MSSSKGIFLGISIIVTSLWGGAWGQSFTGGIFTGTSWYSGPMFLTFTIMFVVGCVITFRNLIKHFSV